MGLWPHITPPPPPPPPPNGYSGSATVVESQCMFYDRFLPPWLAGDRMRQEPAWNFTRHLAVVIRRR